MSRCRLRSARRTARYRCPSVRLAPAPARRGAGRRGPRAHAATHRAQQDRARVSRPTARLQEHSRPIEADRHRPTSTLTTRRSPPNRARNASAMARRRGGRCGAMFEPRLRYRRGASSHSSLACAPASRHAAGARVAPAALDHDADRLRALRTAPGPGEPGPDPRDAELLAKDRMAQRSASVSSRRKLEARSCSTNAISRFETAHVVELVVDRVARRGLRIVEAHLDVEQRCRPVRPFPSRRRRSTVSMRRSSMKTMVHRGFRFRDSGSPLGLHSLMQFQRRPEVNDFPDYRSRDRSWVTGLRRDDGQGRTAGSRHRRQRRRSARLP